MKLVSTSSFIFFSLLKMRMRMSGNDSFALWKLSLCSLMKSFTVYSTSVSVLEPSRTLTLSITLFIRLFISFSYNRPSYRYSVAFTRFLISFTSVTSYYNFSSSSA